MKIIFATNNKHKLGEVQAILGSKFTLVTPKELGIDEDIPETGDTLEGNALQKACYLHDRTGMDCFADDTGLEVEALGGEPGVYSARYAGEPSDPAANTALLLEKLKDKNNRSARFRTVIALIMNGREYLFEGLVGGEISLRPSGTEGFGYDPVFVPEGYDITFAEMPAEEKNRMSHRASAVEKLGEFLRTGSETANSGTAPSGADPDTGAGMGTITDSGAGAGPCSNADSSSDVGAGSDSGSGAGTGPCTDTGAGTNTGLGAGLGGSHSTDLTGENPPKSPGPEKKAPLNAGREGNDLLEADAQL